MASFRRTKEHRQQLLSSLRCVLTNYKLVSYCVLLELFGAIRKELAREVQHSQDTITGSWQVGRGSVTRGALLWLPLVAAVLLLAPPAAGLRQRAAEVSSPTQQLGTAKRVLSLFAKLTDPPQEMQVKRERPDEDEAQGGDENRRKIGGQGDDIEDNSDDRETDEEEEEEEDEEDSDSSEEEEGSDGSEIEFTLDELGRVPGGILPHSPDYPDLNYEYRCFTSFLDPAAEDLDKLIADCRTTFTARTTRKGQKYSAGETYWLASDAEPRCALEKLAKRVFDMHTEGKVAGEDFNPTTSGAEWWTLVLDADDDVGLHWDRDYGMEGNGILVHPHLSTVTYLTNVGGPTVVFGCISPMETDTLGKIIGPIDEAFISRPAPGKHISFDGRLLHGAPADANIWKSPSGTVDSKSSRVTFLVNVWLNHVPSSAEPFPADKVVQLASTSLELRQSAGNHTENKATQVDVHGGRGETSPEAAQDTNKVIEMKFVARAPVTLRLPLPVKDLQGASAQVGKEGATTEGSSWLLKFAVTEAAGVPSGMCDISLTS